LETQERDWKHDFSFYGQSRDLRTRTGCFGETDWFRTERFSPAHVPERNNIILSIINRQIEKKIFFTFILRIVFLRITNVFITSLLHKNENSKVCARTRDKRTEELIRANQATGHGRAKFWKRGPSAQTWVSSNYNWL